MTGHPRRLAAVLRGLRVEDDPLPSWWHWVVGVEVTGRLTLPADVCTEVAGWASAAAVSRGQALLLRDGASAPVRVDGRGRVMLPAWLRSACGDRGSVLVAARRPDAAVVVMAPATVMDALVGGLAGEAG